MSNKTKFKGAIDVVLTDEQIDAIKKQYEYVMSIKVNFNMNDYQKIEAKILPGRMKMLVHFYTYMAGTEMSQARNQL